MGFTQTKRLELQSILSIAGVKGKIKVSLTCEEQGETALGEVVGIGEWKWVQILKSFAFQVEKYKCNLLSNFKNTEHLKIFKQGSNMTSRVTQRDDLHSPKSACPKEKSGSVNWMMVEVSAIHSRASSLPHLHTFY